MRPPGELGLARRRFLASLAAVAAGVALSRRVQASLPGAVAGIDIPHTPLCLAAVALSERSCPDFLFNHCMRTYLFGALHARHHGESYDAEPALVAAALHDVGLLQSFESADQPFEVDSANTAQKFATERGAPSSEARLIWDATVMHDMRWGFVSRQNSTIKLVATGAAADVDGPDPDMIPVQAVREVVSAFPRLAFKRRFQELLDGHCKRKPLSQLGTWLDGYCRAAVPGVHPPSTASGIEAAPFAE